MLARLAFPLVMMVMVLAVLLPSFFTFDALVRREHDLQFTAWEADGGRNAMFWRPEGRWFALSWFAWVFRFRAAWATNKCMLVWLFRTPEWARADDHATRLLRRLRHLVLVWNIGLAVVFAAALAVFVQARGVAR